MNSINPAIICVITNIMVDILHVLYNVRYVYYNILKRSTTMMNIPAFLTYVILTTFTPGPNNIMSLSNANRFGFRKTVGFISGITAGFALIIMLCGCFNLFLFNYIPEIKNIIGLIGCLYMIYLAYLIIKDDDSGKNSNGADYNTFFAGMTLQFINPKVIIYGITVQSVFIIPHFKSGLSLLLFSVFLAFAGFISTSLWALFGSIMQDFISGHRKKINFVMALLLVYCAVSVSGLAHV